MKLQLKITTTDNQVLELECGIPEFIAWERHSHNKTSQLALGIGIEDMAYLGYAALKRKGEKLKPFDAWINDIAEIEAIEDNPKATK